jgi:hypothetical protein
VITPLAVARGNNIGVAGFTFPLVVASGSSHVNSPTPVAPAPSVSSPGVWSWRPSFLNSLHPSSDVSPEKRQVITINVGCKD